MALDGFVGLALGAVGLGVVHGIEPGHGWPVAATYALDRSNKWLAGITASTILGIGHMLSSIAMVVAFFWAKDYFELTEIGWMSYVAGVLLLLLGFREYRMYRRGGHHHAGSHRNTHANDHGHERGRDGHEYGHDANEHGHDGHGHVHDSHGQVHDGHGQVHDSHGHDHDGRSHEHDPTADDHATNWGHARHRHGHDHDRRGGIVGRIVSLLPVDLVPDQPDPSEATDRGILGIAAFAFALGFAHEEEFEIIALCLGSDYCLELMLVYAVTVVVAIVAFTVLLIAGYEHYEERVEEYAEYLPLLSAVVLVAMGLGFLFQVF